MSSVQYFENDNTTFLCCTYEIYTNNQIAERFCQNLKERVSGLKVKKRLNFPSNRKTRYTYLLLPKL